MARGRWLVVVLGIGLMACEDLTEKSKPALPENTVAETLESKPTGRVLFEQYSARLYVICDYGRAVYWSGTGAYHGGVAIAIVQNAQECANGAR